MGRLYATIEQVDVGSKVFVDGGFTCIAQDAQVEIKRDAGPNRGLYFDCNCGRHFLAGQREGRCYVGLYLDDPQMNA